MKVILTKKIKTLGNIGDIKDVADGYGKNYLLPKNLVLIYSDKNYESFKIQKEEIEKLDNINKEKALDIKSKIEAKEIIIFENAGDNDRLYGSINSLRIANFVNELIKSKDIRKSNILINSPIRYLGVFEITFTLHSDVVFNKEVIIARSKDEAEKIKKSSKEKKISETVKEDSKEVLTQEKKEDEKIGK